jgi:hypothetical protein
MRHKQGSLLRTQICQNQEPLSDLTGQTKILFCNEGNSTAMLVTNKSGHRSADPKTFTTPARALT